MRRLIGIDDLASSGHDKEGIFNLINQGTIDTFGQQRIQLARRLRRRIAIGLLVIALFVCGHRQSQTVPQVDYRELPTTTT
jgi:hypothetical protein